VHSRPFQPSDLLHVKQLAESLGHPDEDFSRMIEHAEVIVDDDGRVVMALVARRTIYLDMLTDPSLTPAQKMYGLRLCEAKLPVLADKGHREVLAFIDPSIAERFGRRLQRSFGWMRSRPCWCKRLL